MAIEFNGKTIKAVIFDLDGTFFYAFSVGMELSAGRVRDVDFIGETILGVTIFLANSIFVWNNLNYGNTVDDDNLELVMRSICHVKNP
ncbi:MAG TPA: hypothetical protein PLX56_06370, partial [bacterium]|nr:hypothetical protein [bacterium]